jgi:hypothetical protein
MDPITFLIGVQAFFSVLAQVAIPVDYEKEAFQWTHSFEKYHEADVNPLSLKNGYKPSRSFSLSQPSQAKIVIPVPFSQQTRSGEDRREKKNKKE